MFLIRYFIVTKDETRWYLAESLEATADDGCHYQMKLKDGLTWHDGEAITADDVCLYGKCTARCREYQ